MQRLLTSLQILFYVVAISLMLAVGLPALALLDELTTSLRYERLQQELIDRDHAATLNTR